MSPLWDFQRAKSIENGRLYLIIARSLQYLYIVLSYLREVSEIAGNYLYV